MTIVYGAARAGDRPAVRLPKPHGRQGPGRGTGILVIDGVKELHDSRFAVRGDRIVAGTYLCGGDGPREAVCC